MDDDHGGYSGAFSSETAHGILLLHHLGWVDHLLLHRLLLHGLLLHGHLLLVHHLGALRLHLLCLHLLCLHLLRLHWLHAWVVAIHDLLLRHLNRHTFQRVHVLRVHEVVLNDVVVHGRHAAVFDEILHREQIKALLLELLEVVLLLLRPEVALILRHVATKAARLGQLLLKGTLLGLGSGIRSNTLASEVVEHLTWDLLEGLLRQLHRIIRKVSKWHELHNIRGHLLSVDSGVERRFVGIKLFHRVEISGANTDNDNRER